MYTIIRFAFCIIAAIAVLALCKPVRKWFIALNRGLKLILFVGFCGILPLVLLCVSPESDLVLQNAGSGVPLPERTCLR